MPMHTSGATLRPTLGVEGELAILLGPLVGSSEIGLHDDLFDVGLDSLGAVGLIGAVRTTFGYVLSLDRVFTHPTIAGLSLLLRGPAGAETGSLVPIQLGGSRPPTFCVNPIGGSVARYFALARALGPDWPVLGLHPAGLSSGAALPDTVEEIAEGYLDELLRHQPDGPLILLGYSFGGTVAVEMARRLIGGGRPPSLVLIDPPLDYCGLDPLTYPYDSLAKHSLKLAIDPAEVAGLARSDALLRIRDLAVDRGTLAESADLELLGNILDVLGANCRAAKSYVPQPYPGSALLLRSSTEPEPGENGGWRGLISDLTMAGFDPDHFEMLEPAGIKEWLSTFAEYVGSG